MVVNLEKIRKSGPALKGWAVKPFKKGS